MSSPKISTSEAGRHLRDHPANVVRHLSEMVGSLRDCWPDVDVGFVETLRTLRRARFSDSPNQPVEEPTKPLQERSKGSFVKSASTLRVLDKLERKDKWGGNAIGWDTLRNHYCRGLDDLDEAVDELVEEGLLLPGDSRSGPYSLNPAKKGEIEKPHCRIPRAEMIERGPSNKAVERPAGSHSLAAAAAHCQR